MLLKTKRTLCKRVRDQGEAVPTRQHEELRSGLCQYQGSPPRSSHLGGVNLWAGGGLSLVFAAVLALGDLQAFPVAAEAPRVVRAPAVRPVCSVVKCLVDTSTTEMLRVLWWICF